MNNQQIIGHSQLKNKQNLSSLQPLKLEQLNDVAGGHKGKWIPVESMSSPIYR